MSLRLDRRPKRRKLFALAMTMLMVAGLTLAPPAAADWNECAPGGLESARVLPKDLTEHPSTDADDRETTATVQPLGSVDAGTLGLGTPGVLTVGTLSDAPPNICINPTGEFSGFDNQLLRAIAAKLGLEVRFVSTDFSALLAQVRPGASTSARHR